MDGLLGTIGGARRCSAGPGRGSDRPVTADAANPAARRLNVEEARRIRTPARGDVVAEFVLVGGTSHRPTHPAIRGTGTDATDRYRSLMAGAASFTTLTHTGT